MGCFCGCFRGFRKSCGALITRLRGRLARRKVAPTGATGVAASDPENEQQQVPISEPTPSTTSATQEDRPTSKTPEALNLVVEELVDYELHKIKALSQIEDDNVADDLITSDATFNEISTVHSAPWNLLKNLNTKYQRNVSFCGSHHGLPRRSVR